MERKRLKGLPPWVYEHPRDRKTLDALEGTPGLEALVRKFNEWGLEHIALVEHTGSYLRISAHNVPDLYQAVHQACDTLDMPRVPEVYVGPGEIEAKTVGVTHPLLVVSKKAVEKLSGEELEFLVGRELGHIKSGHQLYLQMAAWIPQIASILKTATVGLSSVFTAGLKYTLLTWERTSELTADRAGLLACQEPAVALAVLAKIAGLPEKNYKSFDTDEFVEQAREFRMLDADTVNRVVKAMSTMGRTHPWPVARAHELQKWIDSGDYQTVLTAPEQAAMVPERPKAPSPPTARTARFCVSCGCGFSGSPEYCTVCGTKVVATLATPAGP